MSYCLTCISAPLYCALIAIAKFAITDSLHMTWTAYSCWTSVPMILQGGRASFERLCLEGCTRLPTHMEMRLVSLLCQYAFLAIDIHLRGWIEWALEAFWASMLPARGLLCTCHSRAPDFSILELRRSELAKYTCSFNSLVHSGICKIAFGLPSRHKPRWIFFPRQRALHINLSSR
jgi:hypothetical protein